MRWVTPRGPHGDLVAAGGERADGELAARIGPLTAAVGATGLDDDIRGGGAGFVDDLAGDRAARGEHEVDGGRRPERGDDRGGGRGAWVAGGVGKHLGRAGGQAFG